MLFRKIDDPLKRGLEEARQRAAKVRNDLQDDWNFYETEVATTTLCQDDDVDPLLNKGKKLLRDFKKKVSRYVLRCLCAYFILYQVLAFLEVKFANLNDWMAFDYVKYSNDLLAEDQLAEEYINSKYYDAKLDEQGYKSVLDSSFLPWVKYISTGKEALEYRLSLIENAKESIDLMVYDFEFDETTAILLESLRRAGERGVKVNLLIDGFASLFHSEFSYPFAQLAKSENILLKVYNPLLSTPKETHFRLHSKLMIVDDDYILLGGRNLSNKFFHLESEHLGENNDLDLLIRFPKVNSELYKVLLDNGGIDDIANNLLESQVDKQILKARLGTKIATEISNRKNTKDYSRDDGFADEIVAKNQEHFTDLVLDNLISFASCKMYFLKLLESPYSKLFNSLSPREYFDKLLNNIVTRENVYHFVSQENELKNITLSEADLLQDMVPSEKLFFLNNGMKPSEKSSNMLNMLFTLFKVNADLQTGRSSQGGSRRGVVESRNNQGAVELKHGQKNEESQGLNEEPQSLMDLIYDRNKNILFSPYIVISKDIAEKIQEYRLEDKLKIVTNSPNISPNPFTSADFVQHKEEIVNIFPNISLIDEAPAIHTKAALVSDNLSVISSMNFDTRSIKINAEIMMIVKGKLAQSNLVLNLYDDYRRSQDVSSVEIGENKKYYNFIFRLLTFLRDLY